jgi:hypothetical protein
MYTDNINRLSFAGQHIFVGLDVSKKSWKTCILTKDFEHKTFTQPPKAEILGRYLRRNFPDATYHCVYEAGYFGFWIHGNYMNRESTVLSLIQPIFPPGTKSTGVRPTK